MNKMEEDTWGCDCVRRETAQRIKWIAMGTSLFLFAVMVVAAFHYYRKEEIDLRGQINKQIAITCHAQETDVPVGQEGRVYMRCVYYAEDQRKYWNGFVSPHNETVGLYYTLYALLDTHTQKIHHIVWDRSELRIHVTGDYYFIAVMVVGALSFLIVVSLFCMSPKQHLKALRSTICLAEQPLV